MNPSINLMHLRFFCDAVIYESVSEAAKKNFISQSAVSQAITKLESIFDVQLVYLSRHKLHVTDEGRVLFNQATAIFRDVKTTFDLVNQTKEKMVGTVRFASTKSLGSSVFAPLYTKIKQALPDIDFSFRLGGLSLIRTAVKQEDVDFAIVVYDDFNFGQFEKYPLRKGKFQLYQPQNFASKAYPQELLISDPDCMYVSEIKKFLEEKRGAPINLISLRGWDLVARFTDLENGVGFFPEHLCSRYLNIMKHPAEIPSYEYEICAIYNKGVQLSKAALAFLEHFKKSD